MIKKVSLLILIVCSFANVLLMSCGKQASDTTAEVGIESTFGPDIYPEVIMQKREVEGLDFAVPYAVLAFKTKEGEYVVYDNDADYTQLCQDAKIVGNICNYWKFENGFNGGVDVKLWNDSIKPWLEKIASYTREYYYGDKKCIPNDVFEFIDRYNYDKKPFDTYYTLRESKYNEKVYGTPSGINDGYCSITFRPLGDLNIRGGGKTSKCVTLENGDLPSNILVCEAPFF